MSLRLSEAISAEASCCCQTKSCGSRAAETEKQGKMSFRLSEAISAEASCSVGRRWILYTRSSGFWPRPLLARGCCCQLNLVEAEQQREKQGKMSLRSSEAISAQASCSEGVEFFMRSSGIWPRPFLTRRCCCCQIKYRGSRAAETEKRGKMWCRPAEVISAEASCTAGVGFFKHVHPAFGRAPLSPEAASAKQNCGGRAAETEKQGKMSRRPAEASYTGTSCSAGKYSCTFIQSLVALLSRQRRLLPNTISWRQSSRDGEAGEDVAPPSRSHLHRGELLDGRRIF